MRASNCGIAILNEGWVHPTRNLNTSVLILGKKSTAGITDEGDALTVEPGKFVLLPAERTHRGTRPIREAASYFWMHFSTAEPPVAMGEREALRVLNDPEAVARELSDALLLPQEIALDEPKVFLDLVITSYSIHYTKLYENAGFRQSPHIWLIFRILMGSFLEMDIESRTASLYPAGCTGLSVHSLSRAGSL